LGLPCRVYRRKPFVTEGDPPPANIRFVDLPSTRIKGFEAAFHTLLCVAHLIVHPVKIVNIHNIGPAFLSPLLKLFGMKVVLTYHSTNYKHDKWGMFSKMILKAGEKIGFRWADRIIFVNESMRLTAESNHVLHKSVFIPNPITAGCPDTSSDYCTKIGVTPYKYILAVGRLTPEKGFETLLRAANSLPDDYKIVIAGAADHNPDYLRTLKELDKSHRVIFTGYADRDTLNELYSHARIFVLPSLFEGMSLALLEAMSFGLPVCLSDIDANHLPELENRALFFNPTSSEALSDAINRALQQPQRTDYDLSRYSPTSIIAETAGVYSNLLAES
ncbi:MAG: glycosyltransferase family 4 protein, partial [Paramuribaculum sp.]|nr:glycosyltransferase family 4 protein [Paramuribaculum sp.]